MSLMGENFYLDNWFMFAKVPLNATNSMPPQRQLCAGWQFDSGPLSFENVCYVLDYESVRSQKPGYSIATAIPCEEVYVPEGLPVLPLKAADEALAIFKNPNPE